MSARGSKTRAMLVVVALLATLVAAPAGAQEGHAGLPPEVLVREFPNGNLILDSSASRVYDDMASPEFVVIAGGDMYDVCLGRAEEPRARMIARQSANGTWAIKQRGAGVELYTSVYRTDMEVFSFFDATCGAFFEEGTTIPAPFATGLTTMRLRERQIRDLIDYVDPETPQGQGRYTNGVTGVVADADGNEFDLVTVADFVITARGMPKFKELSVSLTPVVGP